MLIMHIGSLACFHAISLERLFQQNRHIIFLVLVALKLLVSLISRLVACSARIVVDTHTDRQTDTQNDYCNPLAAHARRGLITLTTCTCIHVYKCSRMLSIMVRA